MTMEKRAILAAILMAALLIIYQAYLFPLTQPPPAPEQQVAEPERPAEQAPPAPAVEKPAPVAPARPPAAARRVPPPPQRTATIETPLFDARVSSEGGKLLEWTLHYRGEKPMVVVGEFGPRGLAIAPAGGRPEPVPMHLDREALTLGPQQPADTLGLRGETDGLLVTKSLNFQSDSYAVEAAIRVENTAAEARTVTVSLPWSLMRREPPPEEQFPGQRPTEIVWAKNGNVFRINDLASSSAQALDGEWIGLDSTWYLAALLPRAGGFGLVAVTESGDGGSPGMATITVQATPTIAPGQAWEGRVVLYIGPKEYDRLAAYGLEGTLNFGGFPIPRKYGGLPMEWLGVPILKLMNWVYRYVGNYGIAIILLTILSKVLFYPLTVKSIRSMRAMQALQPQVNALRSKYRSDPRKLQEETLALYRKHRVNPMGGCLPMLAQVPIFYALYLALSVSVELQNAAFLCFGRIFGMDVWICDLASHDPTYILPVLMGVSMFVQQKMTPTMGDPRQAKMMLFMPFVFTFMFLNLPSGLVLYWTVSNLLQILQQWYMDRPAKGPAPRGAKNAARA